MTYNLMLTGRLDPPRIAAALASLTSMPIDAVDVGDVHDRDSRNWDAPVNCTYERVNGDITCLLVIYFTDAVTVQPPESEVAAHLAEHLETAVLFPAAEIMPSAYWAAAPGGLLTRARLYNEEDLDMDPEEGQHYAIDAVAEYVPALPSVRVALQPEVIPEHVMPTPISDELTASLAGMPDEDRTLWNAGDQLTAWENLIVRMTSGWPPDGWYPVEYYQEDLGYRDELATVAEKLPAVVAGRFAGALDRLDEGFRAATVEGDATPSGADPAGRGWWWRRLPDPVPWPGS